MFPTVNHVLENKRTLCDRHTIVTIPTYLGQMLSDLSEDRKIDAIKLTRLIYPGMSLLPAKTIIEFLNGTIGVGVVDSGRLILEAEFLHGEDALRLTVVEHDVRLPD